MHGSGTGTSHSKRRNSLPCARREVRVVQVVLAAALVLAGLRVAEQWGRHEQRGRVRRRQNAAELVAGQLVRDLHPDQVRALTPYRRTIESRGALPELRDEDVRKVSPLLGSRHGSDTAEDSMEVIATKIAELVHV